MNGAKKKQKWANPAKKRDPIKGTHLIVTVARSLLTDDQTRELLIVVVKPLRLINSCRVISSPIPPIHRSWEAFRACVHSSVRKVSTLARAMTPHLGGELFEFRFLSLRCKGESYFIWYLWPRSKMTMTTSTNAKSRIFSRSLISSSL